MVEIMEHQVKMYKKHSPMIVMTILLILMILLLYQAVKLPVLPSFSIDN